MNTTTELDNARRPATTEDLRRQAKVVKDDLTELGRTAKDVARDKIGDANRKAADSIDAAKQRSVEYYEKGKQEAARLEGQVEGYIRQNPLKSILIASGAGVLLGMLMRRR